MESPLHPSAVLIDFSFPSRSRLSSQRTHAWRGSDELELPVCPGASDLVLTFLFTESGQAVPALRCLAQLT